jgi:hypothetical protein
MYEPYIALVAGILARMLIPWLVQVYKNRNGWNWQWKYLRGQLVAAVIAFVALPLLLSDLAEVGSWGIQEAFLAGYGAAEIGRFLDKAITE